MPDRLPKRKNTGEPLRKFRLLAGVHCDADGTHKKGEIVKSELDLVAIFGREKFFPLFAYGRDVDDQEAMLLETEYGQETPDEIAARVRAEVLAQINSEVPQQCSKFNDCLREDGHSGPCAFARPDRQEVVDRALPPLTPQNKTVQPPTPKSSPTKSPVPASKDKVPPVKTNTAVAPPVTPTKVKSPTSQYDDLTLEELKRVCEDEEVDTKGCVTKEDYIKVLKG